MTESSAAIARLMLLLRWKKSQSDDATAFPEAANLDVVYAALRTGMSLLRLHTTVVSRKLIALEAMQKQMEEEIALRAKRR